MSRASRRAKAATEGGDEGTLIPLESRLHQHKTVSSGRYTVNRAVECISFNGITTRFPDQMLDLLSRHPYWRLSSGHMYNLFFNYCPIEIIRSKIQTELGRFCPDHNPVGFDMGEIIEHQSGHGNGPQVKHGRGRWQVVGHGHEAKGIFNLKLGCYFP